jgi:hypothetical protein
MGTKETAVVTYGKAKCGEMWSRGKLSISSAANVALTATPSLVYARLCSNRRICNFFFILYPKHKQRFITSS